MIERLSSQLLSEQEASRNNHFFSSLNLDSDAIIAQDTNWSLLKRDIDFFLSNNILTESMKKFIFQSVVNMDNSKNGISEKSIKIYVTYYPSKESSPKFYDKFKNEHEKSSILAFLVIDSNVFTAIFVDKEKKVAQVCDEKNRKEYSNYMLRLLMKNDSFEASVSKALFIPIIQKNSAQEKDLQKLMVLSVFFKMLTSENYDKNGNNQEKSLQIFKDKILSAALTIYKINTRRASFSRRKTSKVANSKDRNDSNDNNQKNPPKMLSLDPKKNILDMSTSESFLDLGASMIGYRKLRVVKKNESQSSKALPKNETPIRKRDPETIFTYSKTEVRNDSKSKSLKKSSSNHILHSQKASLNFLKAIEEGEEDIKKERKKEKVIEKKNYIKLMEEMGKFKNLYEKNKERVTQINTYNQLFKQISQISDLNENTQKVLKLVNNKVDSTYRQYRKSGVTSFTRKSSNILTDSGLRGGLNSLNLKKHSSNVLSDEYVQKPVSFLHNNESERITNNLSTPNSRVLSRFSSNSPNRNEKSHNQNGQFISLSSNRLPPI